MNRPGQPEDLDDPQLLWTRAAVAAVAAAAEVIPADGMHIGDDGVFADQTGGSNWWLMTLAHNGEAVFTGQDSDASHTHLGDEPVDLLAGLPERLSWKRLRDDQAGRVLGFAYWYTDGAWHRADYPGDLKDDGLEYTIGYLADDEATIDEVTGELPADDENGKRAVADVLAKAREGKLRPGDVTAMLNTIDSDIGADAKRTRAALEAASATGLLAGTKPPLIGEPAAPADSGAPSDSEASGDPGAPGDSSDSGTPGDSGDSADSGDSDE